MEPTRNEPSERRPTLRPDGSRTPSLKRPWARWDILGRADSLASILVAVAIGFSATAAWNPGTLVTRGFAWVAPLVAAAFLAALLAMFFDRERHGIARTTFAGGAVVLAIAGLVFGGRSDPAKVLIAYWLPAVLSLMAAMVLVRGHKEGKSATPPRPPAPRL